MTLDLGTLERQLIAHEAPNGRGFTDYVLTLPGRTAVVGRYRHYDRVLEKRHDPDHHAHRLRRGTGLNLELVALLDKVRPAPAHVELVTRIGPDGGGHPADTGTRRRVKWSAVVAYAAAALDGDVRWLLTEDADRQVLLPYAAWNGLVGPPADVKHYPASWAPAGHRWADGPPPRPSSSSPAPGTIDAPPPTPTLFD